MDSRKLKGIIIANDGNQAALATAMGISLSRLNAKINETNATFTRDEIEFIRNRYNLTRKQLVDIFFTDNVS